jgi:DNA-binding NtrC family response regulator
VINAQSPTAKTVCLVDDEIEITEVIRMGLERAGFIVHAFNDPKKAWEYFQIYGKSCTVVLSDIRMPGMSGFEFARNVKGINPDAPVILMSSFEINNSEFVRVLPHIKVEGFIQKPISINKLVKDLKRY